jgi:hypothetical protein
VIEIKEFENHQVVELGITTMSSGDRDVIRKWAWELLK